MTNKIETIIREIPIASVLERYGVQISHGRFACPIHNGKNLSCSIDKTNWFHCFVENKNYNAINLVMNKEGCDGRRAVELLGEWYLPELNRKMTDAEKREWREKKSVYDLELREIRQAGIQFLKTFQGDFRLTYAEREKFLAWYVPHEKQCRQKARHAEIERQNEIKSQAELRVFANDEWQELDAINARLVTVTKDAYENYEPRIQNAFWLLVGKAVALHDQIKIKTHEARKAVAA